MTDRVNSLTVVLETDTRVDDAQALIQAIRQMRGVIAVSGNVADLSDYVAHQRVRNELWAKVVDVFFPQGLRK